MFKARRYPLYAPANDGTPPAGGAAPPGTPPASGTPPMTPPAGGGTPPASGGTPPAGGEWYDSFQDPAVKDWVKAYGDAYKTPESMALKAYNLEKFVGADKAGRGVIIPKPDAPAEEWAAFFKKAGTPDKPDGYKVPTGFENDPLIAKFREHAHKSGMPAPLFDAVMGFFGSEIVGSAKAKQDAQLAEFERNSEKDWNDLRQEWVGKDTDGNPMFDKNVELGRRAARQFVPHENAAQLEETLAKIEGALGTKFTMKLWANIGNGLGEHSFTTGDDNANSGSMSVEGAKLRIAELKRDPVWAAKFTKNDADAKAEWSRLHKIAYGDKPA